MAEHHGAWKKQLAKEAGKIRPPSRQTCMPGEVCQKRHMSHPMVGVELLGPKVSGRLAFSSVELSVSTKKIKSMLVFGLGRVAQADVFEVMFRVIMVMILSSSCWELRKLLLHS